MIINLIDIILNILNKKRPDDIVQFKGDSATNVYAPIVRRQKVKIPDAFNLGKQKAYEMRLDAAIKERLNTIEEEDGIKTQRI